MDEFKNLSFNIRRYRKMHNLTQTQLAEKLFLTAQNVSKWENGISLPDLTNLYRLSRLFSVSMDTLLGVNLPDGREKNMIAIDGGGTKTEFVLFNDKGKVMKRLILPGSNPNSCGMQNSLSTLYEGLDILTLECADICAIYGGIAGCALEKNRNKILSALYRRYSVMKIDIRSDILNVINCSPCEERAIAVICGTGSVVYAKTVNELHRVGGWGYLFDEGGSGFDIGRDGICAALAESDGIGRKTAITPLVERNLNSKVFDSINSLYTESKDYIASFSTAVIEAFENGDTVAKEIIEKNMGRLAFLIENAARMYDCGNRAIISGGMISHNQSIFEVLRGLLGNSVEIEYNGLPQILGAAIGCCKLMGMEYGEIGEFRDSFMREYNQCLVGE